MVVVDSRRDSIGLILPTGLLFEGHADALGVEQHGGDLVVGKVVSPRRYRQRLTPVVARCPADAPISHLTTLLLD